MIEQNVVEGAHPAFPQAEDDSLVWRYIDLPKLIFLLANHKLYLTAINRLDDPHEGSVTRECHEKLKNYNPLEQPAAWREEVRNNSFVCCWSLSNSESEAMWQLYCGRNQGVAIQTTYRQLRNSIPKDHRLGIGVVRYLDYHEDDMPDYTCYAPVMHKRQAFKHEQEVRILCSMVGQLYDERDVDTAINGSGETEILGMFLSWNAEEIINKIYINPYAMHWYSEVVKTTISKFSPKLASCIECSQMRTDPYF